MVNMREPDWLTHCFTASHIPPPPRPPPPPTCVIDASSTEPQCFGSTHHLNRHITCQPVCVWEGKKKVVRGRGVRGGLGRQEKMPAHKNRLMHAADTTFTVKRKSIEHPDTHFSWPLRNDIPASLPHHTDTKPHQPAKIMRSPHDSPLPYLSLIGASRALDLSAEVMSQRVGSWCGCEGDVKEGDTEETQESEAVSGWHTTHR